MITKIKNFVLGLKNPQMLGLAVLGVIAMLIVFNGVKVIESNYKLQQQIGLLEQKNKNQELENANLRIRNKYLETNEYLELTARRVFGKAAPGEKVVIVPKEVALRHASEPAKNDQKPKSDPYKPQWQQNLEAWRDFLLTD